MPNFIPTGTKLNVISNDIWSSNGQALFGMGALDLDIEQPLLTSIQCFAITEDCKKPMTITIYATINTQFKRVVDYDSVPVDKINTEIKICRSFDLDGIYANTDNYPGLHSIGKKFAIECLNHAQFALFNELGALNALPLHIYESLIFNPENIKVKLDEPSVCLTPFIHYYQLLNLPRINLVKRMSGNPKIQKEMSFTTAALNFCLSEQPALNVLDKYSNITNQTLDMYNPDHINLHQQSEEAIQAVFKSVAYDLTMNQNNRSSHEYNLFRDLVHRNNLNAALPKNQPQSDELLNALLGSNEHLEMNYSHTEKLIDDLDSKYQEVFAENLRNFKSTLDHLKSLLESCCHVYTKSI